MPNFASLNQSGISYARSEALVPSKGPSTTPPIPDTPPGRKTPGRKPNTGPAKTNPFNKFLLEIDMI
jgi:hypothetical protein